MTLKNNYDGLWIIGKNNTLNNIFADNNTNTGITLDNSLNYNILLTGYNKIYNISSTNNSYGLNVDGGGYNNISNSYFINNDLALHFTFSKYNNIYNVKSFNNYEGISFDYLDDPDTESCNHNNVYNSISNNNSGDGIFISGDYNSVYNSTANNNYFGIFLYGIYNSVYNSTANNNGMYGIHLYNGEKVGINNVYGSLANNNTYFGISIDGGNASVFNSTANDNGGSGFYLHGNNINLNDSIAINNSYGNKLDCWGPYAGVCIDGDYNIISNLLISNNTAGIQIGGSNNTIIGNRIFYNNVSFRFESMEMSVYNNKINFNYISNNTNNFFIVEELSVNNISANFNYWDGLEPLNTYSNSINTFYYIKNMTASISFNKFIMGNFTNFIGDNITINYFFILNTPFNMNLPEGIAKIVYNNEAHFLNGNLTDKINITLLDKENIFSFFFCGVNFNDLIFTALYESFLNIKPIKIANYGDIININGTLTNSLGVINGKIYIKINESNTIEVDVIEGFWEYSFNSNILNIGDNINVSVNFMGDNDNSPIISTSLFNISFSNTNTSIIVPSKVLINETVLITGKLKNYIGINMLNVTINGFKYHVFVDNNTGIWSLNYIPTKTGNILVVVSLTNNTFFKDFINTTILNVFKFKTQITLSLYKLSSNGEITIKATLKDLYGNVLTGKRIYFYYSSKKIGFAKTNNNGIATFLYKNSQYGLKSFKVNFNGDLIYNISSNVKDMKIQAIILKNHLKKKGNYLIITTGLINKYSKSLSFKIYYKLPNGFIIKNAKLAKISKRVTSNAKLTYNNKKRIISISFTSFKRFRTISNSKIYIKIKTKKKGYYKILNLIKPKNLVLINNSNFEKIKV